MAINLQESIFAALADFIVSQPSLDAIATYQVPQSVQQEIDFLLEKNAEANISSEERQELEKILLVTDLMNLAKVKAKLKLVGKA